MAEAFGCCSSYTECSNNEACIHTNNLEYDGCQYRKNLEVGRIFYKKSNKGEINIMQDLKISIDVNIKMTPEVENIVRAVSAVLFSAKPETKEVSDQNKDKKTEKVEKVESAAVKEIAAAEEEPPTDEVKTYTLEEVRAKLASISQAGKSAEVKQLIAAFGVNKLTDIPVEKYAELMEKVDKI